MTRFTSFQKDSHTTTKDVEQATRETSPKQTSTECWRDKKKRLDWYELQLDESKA